jgi:uncharacterized delta-60 repeat protein
LWEALVRVKKGLVVILAIAATSVVSGDQQSGDRGAPSAQPRSSGLLAQGHDGQLWMASSARINHEAGTIDKLGSFVFGLGYNAPGYDSAALSLVRLTSRGALEPGFGANGALMTPLLPLKNRHRATVTRLIADSAGRFIVVGWRYQSTALDANFPVIIAARHTSSGALDTTFGERGVVTTRIDKAYSSQAFAAAVDDEGRLLVAGYNGGFTKRDQHGSFDDWPIRVVLLRYTANGALDASFGSGGVASHVLMDGGLRGSSGGRDFLVYDSSHRKTAGLILDRQGRALVAAASDTGPVVLMRFSREGVLDSSFGSAGTVQTPIGKRSSISALLWDGAGRLLAAGTSDDNGVLLRYSADGALDATFGDGGIRRTPLGEGMRVSAALREADGHVLVAASGEKSVQLARYDRDGKPDQSFGPNGVVRTDLDKFVGTTAGIAIGDQGSPLVTVVTANGMFVLRYTAGRPADSTFVAVRGMYP